MTSFTLTYFWAHLVLSGAGSAIETNRKDYAAGSGRVQEDAMYIGCGGPLVFSPLSWRWRWAGSGTRRIQEDVTYIICGGPLAFPLNHGNRLLFWSFKMIHTYTYLSYSTYGRKFRQSIIRCTNVCVRRQTCYLALDWNVPPSPVRISADRRGFVG